LKKTEKGDAYIIDRDFKTFETLLNYLRNKRKFIPEFPDI
jgi:hypothetical protein